MSSQSCLASKVPMSVIFEQCKTQLKIASMADRRTCQSRRRSRAEGLLLLFTQPWMHPRMAMSQQLPFGSVFAADSLFSARTFEAVVTVSLAAAPLTAFLDDEDAPDLVVILARC